LIQNILCHEVRKQQEIAADLATVQGNVAPGYTLGDALGFLEKTANEVLPPTARTDLDGQSRELRESSTALHLTFGLALVFIYLVLAAQFESFNDLLVILGVLPLALAGGLGAEGRALIGWLIVGGLPFGTLLTLFVIPTAYTLPARRGWATGAEAYEPSPAPGPAALADRFRSPQSRREWAQRR
jgi:multidrug efflux pump subunit AcrB